MSLSVSEREIITILQQLIKEKSINPPADTSSCARVIENIFKKENISCQILNSRGVDNVLAHLPGQKEGPKLLFNGHIDVVPPGEEDWTMDPFGAQLEDGYIYGRGAADMKSGIAAMMAAMISLKRQGSPFQGELLFTIVGDEETGSKNGTRFFIENGYCENIHSAIVSEPTDLRIQLGNRGLCWMEITVYGKAAHASRPTYGVNAIYHGAKVIQEIMEMKFPLKNDFFEHPEPSIAATMIQGGIKINVIPNRCSISLDRRLLPGETAKSAAEEIEKILQRLKEEEKITTSLEVLDIVWEPYLLKGDEEIVKHLTKSCAEILDDVPPYQGKVGCTDASHLFHDAGIPVVLFGPGKGSYAHIADERVSCYNLFQATAVYEDVVKRMLGEKKI